MTEKRFRFHNKDKTSMIYDKENERYYFCIDLNKVCDLLNEQHKTIQQLKSERDFYKGHCESEGLLYD